MKSLKDIQKIVKQFNIKPTPEMRTKVLDEALEIQKSRKQQTISDSYTRRTILTSKIKKLAAAAAIVIALLLSITFFDKSATPAYGISEAFELIRQAKTLHVQGWTFDTYNSDAFGAEVSVKLPFEHWYDLEKGRYRLNTLDFDGRGKFGWPENLNHDSTICNGEYEMSGNWSWRTTGESWKNIKFEKVVNSKTEPGWLEFYGKLDNIEGSIIIDQEEINGITCDIWQVEITRQVRDGDEVDKYKLQTWISPATGEIERIKEWRKEGDGPWIQKIEFSMFERNVALSPDLFVTEPPEGEEFRLINTKETAISPNTTGWDDIYDPTRSYAPLAYCVKPVFRLNDGSFLACWQSVDASESQDQTRYFQNLVIGGDLPKLPSQVYAFSPIPNPRNIRFAGFHLAYTKKETEKGPRWYEWSLYVPDNEAPSPDVVLYYQIHYRDNTDKSKGMRETQVHLGDSQEIENEHDFVAFVAKAMAERSDDGNIPEHVNYEEVLRLSAELHDSLTQR